ncbi:MAG: VWA domain-containing protein [Acidobacteria bacterium]|nr:VWA domain-containing protein [Acidobacteriota bacterium]
MTFLNLSWLYLAVPLLLLMVIVRTWRRHYWGHSMVEGLREELGAANPILRLPTLLEALAVGFLLVALLEPVYPFIINRIERGGLQILFVLDLSQSMEEAMVSGSGPRFPVPTAASGASGEGAAAPKTASKIESVKASGMNFIQKRPGDAIGLVVFSNNAYLVAPATFDHDSLVQYLQMVSPQTLVNEGFTAIGEGIFMANQFFDFTKQQGRRNRGQVIILLSDGDNNYGREPLREIEKARLDGTHIYFIGVSLEPGQAQGIADAIRAAGGRYFNVSDPLHLEQTLDEINHLEKGRFYTMQLIRRQPAFFIFALLSFLCMALRVALNGIPHFVELS